MQFLASVLVLMFAVSGSFARAEAAAAGDDSSAERHVFGLGIEPHWLIIGGLGVKADAPITRKVAIELTGMYIPPRSNSKSSETTYIVEDYKWSTYEVDLGATIMVTGDYDHHGFYLQPAVGYTGAKITDFGTSKLSGSENAGEVRFTAGYQWVIHNLRFGVGGGLRVVAESDVVVKDNAGNEVLREKASSLGGFALDGNFSYLF